MIEEIKNKKKIVKKVDSNEEKTKTSTIFIGNKPLMKYVIATIMQLKESNNTEAIIKARGQFISRAVDVAEVVKKRVKETENKELKDSIKINTDSFENEEGKKINISIIEIKLSRK
jgi:DNA-binding protein